jgi:hypothetical protein
LNDELNSKDADIRSLADRALEDDFLLARLLEGQWSKDEVLRYNCHKVLVVLSDEHGELLYPKWDLFVELLLSGHTYRILSALVIIAHLTKVDRDNRFQDIFEDYYAILDGKTMVPAVYIASSSGIIARARPELEPEITRRLLNIDATHHEAGRKDLIKAGAIEAFDQYFEQATDKQGVVDFVRQQLSSSSPKARKAASESLTKWGQGSV